MSEGKVVTREELYEAVWEKPMTHVAKEYGISDVGLRKICQKMHVPTPGRGYWQRKEMGYAVEQEKLPDLPSGGMREVTISPTNIPTISLNNTQSVDTDRLNKAILVAKSGLEEHSLIERARKSLSKAKSNEKGKLIPRTNRLISVDVTPGTLDRALHRVDLLIKALEELGSSAKIDPDKEAKLRVIVNDEELGISIEEKVSANRA